MSNEYWDKQPAERTPEDLPPLMGQNDNSSAHIEAVVAAPTIDGVPCSAEEKRFHNDALAVMAGEEAVKPTYETDKERDARLSSQRSTLSMADMIKAAWLAVSTFNDALNKLRPEDINGHTRSELYLLFSQCGMLMEQSARLQGAEYSAPSSYSVITLKDDLKRSVEQARGENPGA